MISVVQNFICTKSKRLDLLRNEMPKMGEVFKDYEFFVNYNTQKYASEILQLYEDNIQHLNFFNNLTQNWALVSLSMVEEVSTPYTMILCEDFEFRIDYDGWKKIINEFVEKDGSYMPIGRLWKYTEEKYHSGYEEGKELWFYPASKSPGSSLSVDAIYKTEMLKFKLDQLIKSDINVMVKTLELVREKGVSYVEHIHSGNFPWNLPHHFEDVFHELNGYSVRQWGEDVLCAIPRDVVLMHIQEETETRLNK